MCRDRCAERGRRCTRGYFDTRGSLLPVIDRSRDNVGIMDRNYTHSLMYLLSRMETEIEQYWKYFFNYRDPEPKK